LVIPVRNLRFARCTFCLSFPQESAFCTLHLLFVIPAGNLRFARCETTFEGLDKTLPKENTGADSKDLLQAPPEKAPAGGSVGLYPTNTSALKKGL
jgi:hypothetical protein